MYLEHFGLGETPFAITPDTDFVYRAQSHQAAMNKYWQAQSRVARKARKPIWW